MKLIIEKIGEGIFAYHENEKGFKRNKKQRTTTRLKAKELDDECDLGMYGDFHMVFDIKKGK